MLIDLAAQVALHHIVTVDRLADLQHFGVGELRDPAFRGDAHLLADFRRDLGADAVNILQRDDDALVGRDIDACDTRHALVSICCDQGPRIAPRPVEAGPCGDWNAKEEAPANGRSPFRLRAADI